MTMPKPQFPMLPSAMGFESSPAMGKAQTHNPGLPHVLISQACVQHSSAISKAPSGMNMQVPQPPMPPPPAPPQDQPGWNTANSMEAQYGKGMGKGEEQWDNNKSWG